MAQELAAWLAVRAWDSYQVCLATQAFLIVLTFSGRKPRPGALGAIGRLFWEVFQVGLLAALFNVLIADVSAYWAIGLVALTAGKVALHRTPGVLVGVIAVLVHLTVGWEAVVADVRG